MHVCLYFRLRQLLTNVNVVTWTAWSQKKLQEHLTTEKKIKPTKVSRRRRTGVRLPEIKRAAEEHCAEP